MCLGLDPKAGGVDPPAMPLQKVIQDPTKNAYQVGIAHRLRVDPHRVNCHVRPGPMGRFLVDVLVDGRDLNAVERRIVQEYLEEEMRSLPIQTDG